jgi:hypothetical protein
MTIYFSKVTNELGELHIMIYEHGQWRTPMAIMSTYEFLSECGKIGYKFEETMAPVHATHCECDDCLNPSEEINYRQRMMRTVKCFSCGAEETFDSVDDIDVVICEEIQSDNDCNGKLELVNKS